MYFLLTVSRKWSSRRIVREGRPAFVIAAAARRVVYVFHRGIHANLESFKPVAVRFAPGTILAQKDKAHRAEHRVVRLDADIGLCYVRNTLHDAFYQLFVVQLPIVHHSTFFLYKETSSFIASYITVTHRPDDDLD